MGLGSLADRTKHDASVCSQPITAHTEGCKRWAQHGTGGDAAGGRAEAGRPVPQEGCGAVGQKPQKIESKGGLVRYKWGNKTKKMQFEKKQARMTREKSFEKQMLNCGRWRGKEEPANSDDKMELKVTGGRKSETRLQRT